MVNLYVYIFSIIITPTFVYGFALANFSEEKLILNKQTKAKAGEG